jgi:tRNA 2-thiouridine synthesizing protein E
VHRARQAQEGIRLVKIKVFMRTSGEPLKRTPIVVQRDAEDALTCTVLTDRDGVAYFDLEGRSGKVLVSGIERYHGPLSGEIPIGLWSMTQAADSSQGVPASFLMAATLIPA